MSPGYILLLVLPLVTSMSIDLGPCPERAVQANFSVEQIQSLPSLHEEGRCGSAVISWRGEDSPLYLDVTLTKIMLSHSNLNSKCYVFTVIPWAPWWVLMTDYTQVAVSYSCIEVMGLFHLEYAWITARERYLSSDALKVALSVLDEEDIGMTVMSDQEDCFYY
ncbi:hypothetical protein CRUP_028331 [Coryphaenoides rupestris]|nr:hypothetical protein CRUP_028331 [Coryphaenoides rupestris]